jgi:hypothetical protein
MTHHHRPWTAEDDKTMRENAGRISDAEIGEMTGHARETVARHRGYAGLPAYHPTRRQQLLLDAAGGTICERPLKNNLKS